MTQSLTLLRGSARHMNGTSFVIATTAAAKLYTGTTYARDSQSLPLYEAGIIPVAVPSAENQSDPPYFVFPLWKKVFVPV
jgi:hypothetical protein